LLPAFFVFYTKTVFSSMRLVGGGGLFCGRGGAGVSLPPSDFLSFHKNTRHNQHDYVLKSPFPPFSPLLLAIDLFDYPLFVKSPLFLSVSRPTDVFVAPWFFSFVRFLPSTVWI